MITLTREEAQQALDALELHWENPPIHVRETVETLRARLAQPEPQREQRAYTLRKWQGLTDEEILEFEIWLDDEEERHGWNPPADIVKAIEAKLKAKNA
jgi:hypothetical protein